MLNHFKFAILPICILLFVPSPQCVKVNMRGSLSLGKDVMDTISHYLKRTHDNVRRSMDGSKESDRNTFIVKSASLCRDLEICEGKYEFVNEYIVLLANAIESIFDGVIHHDTRRMGTSKTGVFEEHLKLILIEIKKVIKQANSQIAEDKEAYVWMDIIKKISAIFMAATTDFINQRLQDGEPSDIKDIRKKLMQNIVLATVIVESKYTASLCDDFNVCPKMMECTRSLNTFLEHFKDMPDDKVRMFMRYFFESLPENVFSFLSEETANEFQIVLSDMIYSETVPAKNILLSVQKTVEIRLRTKPIGDFKKSYDVMLTHMILSDMDHFYPNKHRMFNFDGFLTHFEAWVKSGGRLHTEITQVMKDIKKKLVEEQKEMVDKLINEVKVFLELTLDQR